MPVLAQVVAVGWPRKAEPNAKALMMVAWATAVIGPAAHDETTATRTRSRLKERPGSRSPGPASAGLNTQLQIWM